MSLVDPDTLLPSLPINSLKTLEWLSPGRTSKSNPLFLRVNKKGFPRE